VHEITSGGIRVDQTMTDPQLSPADPDGLYFYLSRAYADRDDRQEDPDFWVNRVFTDLCLAVKRVRDGRPLWRIGYLDPCTTEHETEQAAMSALRLAEVFVALYSIRYLNDGRSMTHRTRFQTRFAGQPAEVAYAHLLPVLWEPTAEIDGYVEFRDALELAPDLPAYAEVGLVGLSRLGQYRDPYERLLRVLSRRIVDVAEGSVTSRTPGARPEPGRGPAAFVVAVLAPRLGEIPGRWAQPYGSRSTDWRPFGPDPSLSIARQTAGRVSAHQLARVLDHDDDVNPFADSPGVLLIDPWIIDTPDGWARLQRALDRLPAWVQPVVLVDENDPQYKARGAQLADGTTELCDAVRRRTNSRRDLRSVEAFDVLMPIWLQFAYRGFLRRHGRPPSPAFGSRPRLGAESKQEEQRP
jgi:FxsC-like protein